MADDLPEWAMERAREFVQTWHLPQRITSNLAAALIAARHEALEEAATVCDGRAAEVALSGGGPDNTEEPERIAYRIRALLIDKEPQR